MVRTESETEETQFMYEYVKRRNSNRPKQEHTMLIEIILSENVPDTTTYDYWHKVVHCNSQADNVAQVQKPTCELVEFQHIVHGLG